MPKKEKKRRFFKKRNTEAKEGKKNRQSKNDVSLF
jgi:hypothetical protein